MTIARGGTTKMLQAEGAEAPVKVEFDNFEHGFPDTLSEIFGRPIGINVIKMSTCNP
jgi:hypothetical protein